MEHLDIQIIGTMAEKLLSKECLTSEECYYLYHVKQCDYCARRLRARMALGELLSDPEAYALWKEGRDERAQLFAAVRVFRAGIAGATKTVLEQVERARALFTMQPKLDLNFATRGESTAETIELEEADHRDVRIRYQAISGELTVQLAPDEVGGKAPKMYLEFDDGERQDMEVFVSENQVYGSCVPERAEGFVLRIEKDTENS